MKRIIDVNVNRATEATKVLEEITRFCLDDKELSGILKNIRHEVCSHSDVCYEELLASRDTVNDVGVNIKNPSVETSYYL